MDLPRDEMAFRKRYQSLVEGEQLTTVFRPGDRVFPNFRGYKPRELITARIIETPGSDEEKIPPLFNDIKVPIQIVQIETFNVYSLTNAHFQGSSPDVQNIEELLEHLEAIYSQPISNFNDEITRIVFNYLKVAQTA